MFDNPIIRELFGVVAPEQVPGLPWWPLLLVIVALIVINIVNNRLAPQSHTLLWAFGSSVLLIAIGLLDGNTWTDLGLSWRYWIPGLIWAGLSIGVITLFYLIGASFGRTRKAFEDERNAVLSGGTVAFRALVEVPFGTVLLEEIAFRSVLFAMLARRYGLVWAIVISSILFGLWHVLPSIGTHEQNPALNSMVGGGLRGNILTVAGSVLGTALAGVVFAGLRVVSGSVLGPMGLHWATNGLGYTFSWAIIRWRRGRPK
ncbi:MAG: CPBP family intramembrane metalloprotease [Actinomycetales bacterium]|nr:CPBP family intramembrane metalloprotease [Actinomycetales bacterium]